MFIAKLLGFIFGIIMTIIGAPFIFIGACFELGRLLISKASEEIDKQQQNQRM